MIDRWGDTIIVGWQEHEILWVKAAIKLPRTERSEAFQDIASMTGRPEYLVREKAKELRAKARADFAKIMVAACPPRGVLVPVSRQGRPRLLPSQLSRPTKAQLMAGR